MEKRKRRLYVGCAINNLSADERAAFLGRISDLKDSLREHFDVLDFVGAPEASSESIYLHDIRDCVGTADCMLAVCNHPSTGMGYEMATAIEKRGIPVLAVAHAESSVSKLILGISHPRFRFERYSDLSEVLPLVISLLGDKGTMYNT